MGKHTDTDVTAGQIALDDLAAEKLSDRILKAIERTTVRKSLDLHIVIEGDNLSITAEAHIPLVKVTAVCVTVAGTLWVLVYWLFPALQPLLDRIASGV